jgi:hypothetical protein
MDNFMTEQEAQAVAARVMSDATVQPIIIEIIPAWSLISALILAAKHPGIHSAMRKAYKEIGRLIQDAIAVRHPDAKTVNLKAHTVRSVGIVHRTMKDTEPIQFNLTICQLWTLVGGIQTVVLHPEVTSDMKARLIEVGRQFQGFLAELHDGAGVLLEMGWNADPEPEGYAYVIRLMCKDHRVRMFTIAFQQPKSNVQLAEMMIDKYREHIESVAINETAAKSEAVMMLPDYQDIQIEPGSTHWEWKNGNH